MSDIVITVICFIAGCLMCFNGYKLFRLSLAIAGGVAGFVLGKLIIELTGNAGITWNSTGTMIFLAVFAVGCGILAFKLYMKALIAITTIVCAFWFYDDFNFLFNKIENAGMRIILTCLSGLVVGAIIGVIVYYAQKWTISLFTAFVGGKIISAVFAPILWSGLFSGEYAGIIEKQLLGPEVELNYTLIRLLVLVAFCAAGFVVQLKTSKK